MTSEGLPAVKLKAEQEKQEEGENDEEKTHELKGGEKNTIKTANTGRNWNHPWKRLTTRTEIQRERRDKHDGQNMKSDQSKQDNMVMRFKNWLKQRFLPDTDANSKMRGKVFKKSSKSLQKVFKKSIKKTQKVFKKSSKKSSKCLFFGHNVIKGSILFVAFCLEHFSKLFFDSNKTQAEQ